MSLENDIDLGTLPKGDKESVVLKVRLVLKEILVK